MENVIITNASMKITPLANWVNLDCNLFITNDLFAFQKSNEELIKILRNKNKHYIISSILSF
jgi:hypothetical protein